MLEFDPVDHVYRLGGHVVPSVTQIIAPLHSFDGVPADVLERKRALGTDVHLACELDDLGELDDEATDPEVMGYVTAWRLFKAEAGARVLMNEQRLAHDGLRFAGTLDRLVEVRTGEAYLVDLKTSVSMSAAYGVQLAGYEILLQGVVDIPPIKRKGLQLRPDGTYKLAHFTNPNDRPCFMGLLALHHWKTSAK